MTRGQSGWGGHTNKISVLEVEAVELVAGLFRVHDVFVDYECSAFCVVGDALADLAGFIVSSVRSEKSVKLSFECNRSRFLKSATYRTGPNLPKRSKSSSGVTL